MRRGVLLETMALGTVTSGGWKEGTVKDPVTANLPVVGMENDSVGVHDITTTKAIKDNDMMVRILWKFL